MIGAAPLLVQNPSRPEGGTSGFATGGGPVFLLNKRADVLSTDRPYNHFGSAITTEKPPVNTYDTSVLVVANPSRCAYLDMYVQAPTTTAATTPCIVKAYGIVVGSGLSGNRAELSTPNQFPGYNPSTLGTFHPSTDFVFNLEDPTTGEYALTFDTAAPVAQPETGAALIANVSNIGGWASPSTSAYKAFSASKRRTVYTAGADFIIALITQADNRANSCLVGRFVY